MKELKFFTRFAKYYKKHGLLKTFQKVCQDVQHLFFKSQMVLYYAELKELPDTGLSLPQNINIECRRTYDDAYLSDMQKLTDYRSEKLLTKKIKDRFEKGAVLWIIKQDGAIAGFIWSIRGKTVKPYYIPLTPDDVFLFDVEVFDTFRGRGLYPLLTNYMVGKLKSEGVIRAFGDIRAWNASSILGAKKTYFHKLAEVRTFNIFGRNITMWS